MGVALVVGVATKIVVEKENYYTKGCTKKDVWEDLKDELDLNFYNIEEDDQNVILYICDKLRRKGASPQEKDRIRPADLL